MIMNQVRQARQNAGRLVSVPSTLPTSCHADFSRAPRIEGGVPNRFGETQRPGNAETTGKGKEARVTDQNLFTLTRIVPGPTDCHGNGHELTADLSDAAFLALTGYRPEEFAQRRAAYDRLIHPDDRDALRRRIQTALRLDTPYQCTYRIVTKRGGEKWVLEQGCRLSNPGSAPEILHGFVTDVTEQKSLEDQFRASQKLVALGQLAGGVAHDFNNLLNVIGGYAEIACADPELSRQNRNALDQVVKATQTGAGLARQILSFCDGQDTGGVVISVPEFVDEIAALLRPLLDKTVDLDIHVSDAEARVEADPAPFSHALINLVLNARDALPGRGSIRIDVDVVAADAGPRVRLAVSDNGRGMDRETAARIFEPFFTTKRPGAGTGLGLAMVRRFVDRSGGSIDVQSEPRADTTFAIYLPLATQQSPVAAS